MLQLPGQPLRVKVSKACITFGTPSTFYALILINLSDLLIQ